MRKLLFIDSSKASSFNSHDDFLVSINSNFINIKETEDLYVYPIEFTCRRDFFSVSNFNNAFSIFYNGQDHFFSIETGFPSVLNIDDELKNDLIAELGGTWSIIYNQYKGRIEINGTINNPPNDLALNFNIPNTAAEVYGFSRILHPFSINGNNVSLVGDNLVNVRGETDLWIRTSLTIENVENRRAGLLGTDCLFKVPILVSPLSVIYYNDQNKDYYTKVKNREINNISIKITDEDNNLIGLNSNCQIVLAFDIVERKRNKVEEYLRNMWEFTKMKEVNKSLK